MSNLGFLVFLIACAIQHTFVGSIPVNSNSETLSKEWEIAGQAAVSIAKATKEFTQSVASSFKDRALFGLSKSTWTILLRAHVAGSAADAIFFKSKKANLGPEELREFHITAKSVIQLRERLDKMEKTEEILNRVVDETANHIVTNKLNLKQSLTMLYEMLDRSFKVEPTLREMYTSVREKNQKELKAFSMDEYDSFDEIPEQAKQKLARTILNKLFLHHIDNRVTIYDKEYFTLARSAVELAKGKKFETVQNIYQKTLSEVTPTVDLHQLEVFEATDKLFEKLKENFKKYPTLESELQLLQKDVSQRQDWNKGIWDLDIFFL